MPKRLSPKSRTDMKLNNRLIVTLPDFARYFNFMEFYGKRKQFVRDMNPDKVYYWNKSLKDAYGEIQQWIEGEDNPNGRTKGLAALNTLLDGCLDMEEATSILDNGHGSIHSKIINVLAGKDIHFPQYSSEDNGEPIQIELHKLEITGKSSLPVNIYIGDNLCGTLKEGEPAYITEINGKCIELLPNHLCNESWDLKLLNKAGGFFSSLVIRNIETAENEVLDDVTSFAVLSNGYIYIDDRYKPVFYTDKDIPQFMLKQEGRALYAKTINDDALVLYSDGTLRSTKEIQPRLGVRKAHFNPEGYIETNI